MMNVHSNVNKDSKCSIFLGADHYVCNFVRRQVAQAPCPPCGPVARTWISSLVLGWFDLGRQSDLLIFIRYAWLHLYTNIIIYIYI